MKYIAIVICLLLAASHLQAQKVNFSAIDTKTGKFTKLDSVRITNTVNGKSIMIYYAVPFFADLGTLSDVNDDIPNEPGSLSYMINMSDQPVLRVNLTGIANLQIKVFDLTGRLMADYSNEFTKGIYRFLIQPGALSKGMYFIYISDGRKSEIQKFIASGDYGQSSSQSMITLIQNDEIINKSNIIENKDIYDFIGYSKKFKPDTIRSLSPSEGNVIVFKIDVFYNKIFSDGKILLNINKGITSKIRTVYDVSSGNEVTKGIDTSLLSRTLNIEQCNAAATWNYGYYQSGYCISVAKPDSSIFFCCDQQIDDYKNDSYTETYSELKLYLDTMKKIINRIEYNNFSQSFIQPQDWPMAEGRDTVYEHLAIEKIPYTMVGGNLKCYIKFDQFKDNLTYSYHKYDKMGSMNYFSTEENNFLGFTNPVDDSSYIEIQLNKY